MMYGHVRFFLGPVLGVITAVFGAASMARADEINVIGFAQQQFRNVSGADADDFHAVFNFPTLAVGQAIPGGGLQAPDGGGGGTMLNWTLNPAVPDGDRFQITYAPGGFLFLAPNLVNAYFTSGGVQVDTESVPIWESFSFQTGSTPSDYLASVTFNNLGSSTVVLSGLTANAIPDQFFTFGEFASDAAITQGFSLSIPSSLTIIAGGTSSAISLGSVPFGNYVLVRGTASLPGNPNAYPFAVAALPVPEPTTMLLLGTGLAGIGAAVRKRRQAKDE